MASSSRSKGGPSTTPSGNVEQVTSDHDALRGLIQEHDRALASNFENNARQEEIQEEYKALGTVLKTLPDKISHDALVPIGPLVMAPGKLIHTNEIMCHMGDNWFVECSAKTALKLVAHRLQKSNEMKMELEKEKQLILAWKAQAVRELNDRMDGTVEIREECSATEHEQWKKEHREKVRKHHAELAKQKLESKAPVETLKTSVEELELWEKLDQLELEEDLALYEQSKRAKAKEETKQKAQIVPTVSSTPAKSPIKSALSKKSGKSVPKPSIPELEQIVPESSTSHPDQHSNVIKPGVLKSQEPEHEETEEHLMTELYKRLEQINGDEPSFSKRKVSFDQSKDITHTFERDLEPDDDDDDNSSRMLPIPRAPPSSPAAPFISDAIKNVVVERNPGIGVEAKPKQRISLFKQERLAEEATFLTAAQGSGDGPEPLMQNTAQPPAERISLFRQKQMMQSKNMDK